MIRIESILPLYNERNLVQKNIRYYTNNPINIYAYSKEFENTGFNNCNMLHNGESKVIKNFIKKNDIVLDVGANVGDWTKYVLITKKFQCLIYAFEPVPNIYKSLEQLKNQFNNNILSFNLALGKKDSEAEINYLPECSGCSSLFNRTILSNKYSIQKTKVTITHLDKFAEEHGITHINFLKIDTEGAELDVLLGAKNLLKNNKVDIIQFEYGGTYRDAHIKLFDVYSYLKENQYLIFRITPNGLIYIPEWNENLENFEYSNYLALRQVF